MYVESRCKVRLFFVLCSMDQTLQEMEDLSQNNNNNIININNNLIAADPMSTARATRERLANSVVASHLHSQHDALLMRHGPTVAAHRLRLATASLQSQAGSAAAAAADAPQPSTNSNNNNNNNNISNAATTTNNGNENGTPSTATTTASTTTEAESSQPTARTGLQQQPVQQQQQQTAQQQPSQTAQQQQQQQRHVLVQVVPTADGGFAAVPSAATPQVPRHQLIIQHPNGMLEIVEHVPSGTAAGTLAAATQPPSQAGAALELRRALAAGLLPPNATSAAAVEPFLQQVAAAATAAGRGGAAIPPAVLNNTSNRTRRSNNDDDESAAGRRGPSNRLVHSPLTGGSDDDDDDDASTTSGSGSDESVVFVGTSNPTKDIGNTQNQQQEKENLTRKRRLASDDDDEEQAEEEEPQTSNQVVLVKRSRAESVTTEVRSWTPEAAVRRIQGLPQTYATMARQEEKDEESQEHMVVNEELMGSRATAEKELLKKQGKHRSREDPRDHRQYEIHSIDDGDDEEDMASSEVAMVVKPRRKELRARRFRQEGSNDEIQDFSHHQQQPQLDRRRHDSGESEISGQVPSEEEQLRRGHENEGRSNGENALRNKRMQTSLYGDREDVQGEVARRREADRPSESDVRKRLATYGGRGDRAGEILEEHGQYAETAEDVQQTGLSSHHHGGDADHAGNHQVVKTKLHGRPHESGVDDRKRAQLHGDRAPVDEQDEDYNARMQVANVVRKVHRGGSARDSQEWEQDHYPNTGTDHTQGHRAHAASDRLAGETRQSSEEGLPKLRRGSWKSLPTVTRSEVAGGDSSNRRPLHNPGDGDEAAVEADRRYSTSDGFTSQAIREARAAARRHRVEHELEVLNKHAPNKPARNSRGPSAQDVDERIVRALCGDPHFTMDLVCESHVTLSKEQLMRIQALLKVRQSEHKVSTQTPSQVSQEEIELRKELTQWKRRASELEQELAKQQEAEAKHLEEELAKQETRLTARHEEEKHELFDRIKAVKAKNVEILKARKVQHETSLHAYMKSAIHSLQRIQKKN